MENRINNKEDKMKKFIMYCVSKRKWHLVIVSLALSLCFVLPCYAGVSIYEKGDWKIGIDDVSAGVFYEFRNSNKLAIAYSSVVTYKDKFNLDLGGVTELTDLDSNLKGFFAGISANILQKNLNENIKGQIGVGAITKTSDIDNESEGKVRLGIYASASIKF